MKAFPIYMLVATFAFLSCSKSKISNDYLTVSNCKDFKLPTQKVNVCFDRVVNDSRCPSDAICTMQGYAVVALKVLIGTELHDIQLATFSGLPQLPSPDTTIQNIKIELQELTPYPCMHCPSPPGKEKYAVKLKLSGL